VTPEINEPDVTTAEAAIAARQANRIIAEPLLLRAGGEKYPLKPAKLAALISFESTADGSYVPAIDEDALTKLVRPLARKVKSEPQNASFTWGAGGITGVVSAVEGRRLDVADSVSAIARTLRERGTAAVRRAIPLSIVASAPALTTQAAEAAAPKMRVLSTWTTYYPPGEGNFWNMNIHIPAWDLDGKVIAPGEWFEFWQGIGPVTFERGYGYGGAIIGGRSVANGAIAGGICSTSTTLFNTAMRAGLEIGERTNHSYYIDRYPMGLDATVLKTDTWETDMTFRNDTANPIVIRSYTGNGWVRFDIWGVPDGRTVRLSTPTTWNHGTAIWTTVVNPNLAPGTSRIVEYTHDGFDASVTRWVYDADGDVLHENVWVSHYRTVNGITEVGPRRTSGDGDADANDA
jgi:vancomycin resistance protein YoaR